MRPTLKQIFSYGFLVASIYALVIYMGVSASAPLAYDISRENVTGTSLIGDVPVFILTLPIVLHLPSPVSLGLIFTLLVLLYTLLLILTLIDGELNVVNALKRLREGRVGDVMNNSFLSTAFISSATILIVLGLQTVQEEAGIPTGEIVFKNKLLEYVSVTYAPLFEEIGFRATTIGLIAIIAFLYYSSFVEKDKGLRMIVMGFFYPKRLRSLIKIQLRRDALKAWLWAAVLCSGLLFGLTHIFLGGGWEIGKVSGTTLAGVVIGYLYIEYGFPSAVISHWTFNYLSQTLDLLSLRFPIGSLFFDGIIVVGGLTIIYLFALLLQKLGILGRFD